MTFNTHFVPNARLDLELRIAAENYYLRKEQIKTKSDVLIPKHLTWASNEAMAYRKLKCKEHLRKKALVFATRFDMLEDEVFKQHPKYTSIQVSNKGRIRHAVKPRAKETIGRIDGGLYEETIRMTGHPPQYRYVSFRSDYSNYTKKMDILVLQTWAPAPTMLTVHPDHIDGDQHNNNIENLRYVTPRFRRNMKQMIP